MEKRALISLAFLLCFGCSTQDRDAEPPLSSLARQEVRLGDRTWTFEHPARFDVTFSEEGTGSVSIGVYVPDVLSLNVEGPASMLTSSLRVPVVERPGSMDGSPESTLTWMDSLKAAYPGEVEISISHDRLDGRVPQFDLTFSSERSIACFVPCTVMPNSTGGPGTLCVDEYASEQCRSVMASLP